jgi:hypothetical protein
MPLFQNTLSDERLLYRITEGDQVIISTDTSPFREGSCASVNKNSPLYVLAGNQIVMKYWSHNCGITEQGVILPRDDSGTCGLILYCEDETIRYFGAPTAQKSVPPVFTLQTTYNVATGIWTYVGALTPSQTAGIIGTTAVNNANAGAVGEYVTGTIASPGTSLTTATSTNVIVAGTSLTAGDWDVWGSVSFLPAATTSITLLKAGLSSTTNTLGAAGTLMEYSVAASVPAANPISFQVPMIRLNQAGTANIFLVAQGTFTVSTLSAYGTVYARRVR